MKNRKMKKDQLIIPKASIPLWKPEQIGKNPQIQEEVWMKSIWEPSLVLQKVGGIENRPWELQYLPLAMSEKRSCAQGLGDGKG